MIGFLLIVLSTSLLSIIGMYYNTRYILEGTLPQTEREINFSRTAILLYWFQVLVVLIYSIYFTVKNES